VFREVQERLHEFARVPVVFSALVKACMQCKEARIALELYEESKDCFVCGKVTYNTLIDAFVRQGDTTKASEVYRDMTLKNVTPDLITYSTLIKGHCASGDLEQGLQLLGLMQKRGIAPDSILFNSILDGCARKQMRSLTEQVLQDMEAAGVAPSNFTLSILVKLYGRCGDLEAAFGVVNTAPKKHGLKINTQVYTCLMSACIANNAMDKALNVYDHMTSSGCVADAKTYQTLLSGCLRHGDVESAMKLLTDTLDGETEAGSNMKIRVDRDAVEGVLMMAVRRGRSEDLALPMLERLIDAGFAISDRVSGAVRRHDSLDAQQIRQRRASVATWSQP